MTDEKPPSRHSNPHPEHLYNEQDDAPQFTFRAVAVGCLLGTVISASNFYMGLKLGWTFGASIFGAIFGFTIMQSLVKAFGLRWFGPKEHCALQTAATAAGSGTTAGYISGIPAMYRLGLLTSITGDSTKIILWAISASLYGIFFAIPLRKYFILKQKLTFPTPTGAANIIKSFHGSEEGARSAGKKTKMMLIVMASCMAWLLLGFFVPIAKTWRVFYWVGLDEVDKWNFYFTASFAFFGAGLMTSLNNASSTLFGAIAGWGIIGPLLLAAGTVYEPRIGFGKSVTTKPTGRYWLLWPGIIMMLAASFTELGCNWRMLWRGVSGGVKSGVGGITKKFRKNHVSTSTEKDDDEDDSLFDPAPEHEQVPALWWGSGILISITITVLVLYFAWDIGVGESLLAIFLGFAFAFIGIQSAGETDINPTGSIAKSSQIVLAALPPHGVTGNELQIKQTINLAAGLVSAASAHQSTDMVGDLKTGHLLGASPRAQFLAQLFGSIFSVATGFGFWMLFALAYPCITDSTIKNCEFPLQAVTAWQAITQALTTSNAIPYSALVSALSIGAFVVVFVVVKNNWIPKQYHNYLINWNAVGVAFVNNDQGLIISLFLGSLVSVIWQKRWPENFEMYMFAVASGLIAGEGVFGVVQAVFSLCGLHEGMGSHFGFPEGSF